MQSVPIAIGTPCSSASLKVRSWTASRSRPFRIAKSGAPCSGALVDDFVQREERRDQVDAARRHHPGRLRVEAGTVLDGVRAGLDRLLDPRRRVGVHGDRDPEPMGLVDERVELLPRPLRDVGPALRVHEGRAGAARLDQVGAVPQLLAHRAPHLIHAVGEARRRSSRRRASSPGA